MLGAQRAVLSPSDRSGGNNQSNWIKTQSYGGGLLLPPKKPFAVIAAGLKPSRPEGVYSADISYQPT